jgi:pilus assembly protein CpaB
MVVAVEVLAETLPPGALRDVEEALGRTLGADVVAGEVLTAARLAPPGGPIAALVPDGLRAVAVATFLPTGIVSRGDRVDVLATFAEGGTEVVATGAEVLLVIGGTGDLGEATTLVLLVTPETARSLAVARAFGDLSVAIAPA